jgi:polysaccharide deacetylase family protein (PEP-CTERM system associated)
VAVEADATGRGATGQSDARCHLLTVVVEDYFHHAAFSRLVKPERWRRFETRVERNTRRALDLLDEYGLKATFFSLGWIAERMPEVLREVAARGHEVACKGYYHRSIDDMPRDEFRVDLLRSREAIEAATGQRVRGYRVAQGSFCPQHAWALDLLAELGFDYDSSFYPRLWNVAREPWRRHPHVHQWEGRSLHEVPLSSVGPDWLAWPVSGGNYLRQLPLGVARNVIKRWESRSQAPFNLYFHVWELDPDVPRIEAVGAFTRVRQYRNLEGMEARLRALFQAHRFCGIAQSLGLPLETVERPAAAADLPVDGVQAPGRGPRQPITVVVPAYNEELAIPYLANTLEEVRAELERDYELHFVFVDDGSTDRTLESLERHFGALPRARILQQPANRGVAEAILAGIRASLTPVVCSIDCDCTYDPRQLADMIPLLGWDVAMVTASPYHREGRVLNVPAWRLSLSRTLSFLYRRVLRNKLATYTACFRVYRRAALQGLQLRNGNFLGVAEMLTRLDLRGARVVEFPAVLEVRMLGYSKMKILRTIRGHLGLLAHVALARLKGADE